MSRHGAIDVGLSSPPDRETLVADLLIDHEQLAEIRPDGDRYLVELYAKRDGSVWQVDSDDLRSAVIAAIELLNDRRGR